MVEEASPDFRLRKKVETRTYLLDEIKHDDLMSEKYKNTYKHLNCVEHLFILGLTGTGCVSICQFALLVSVDFGTAGSAVGITTSAVTAGIKKIRQL